MSETRFTPGPWAMETVRTQCGTCHKVGSFPGAASKENYACIYDDYPPGDGRPENIANAHLIAAAPSMFEALQQCQRVLSDITTKTMAQESTIHMYARIRDAELKARTTLQRATGTQGEKE